MQTIKIGYCGNVAEVADEIYLSDNFTLSAVFVEDEKVDSKMLTFCTLREIPIFLVTNKNNLESAVRDKSDLEYLIICGFGIIVSQSLLNHINAFNFHPGRLPDYKGRHPTFFATKMGEPLIEITLHEVTPGIDEGAIIEIKGYKYRYNETELDIPKKLQKAVESMLPTLFQFINGNIVTKRNKGGKYFPPVCEEDKTFTIDDKASDILNIIRAQTPYYGGVFMNAGKKYFVKYADVQRKTSDIVFKNSVLRKHDQIIGIEIDELKWLRFIDINEFEND